MTRECGQVCKVMLAAQAQTQIQLEHGEISSLGSTELARHTCRALKECFLLQFFALFSSLLLCAERDESYFYVHYHLNDDHSGVFFVVVPSQSVI